MSGPGYFDRPSGGGSLVGLHTWVGKTAIRTKLLFQPRVSLGVRLMALSDGCVFLVRHTYLPGFHLPGGGVDPGESAHDAAAREAREEGGLELDGPARQFRIYWNKGLAGSDHVILFVADTVRQSSKPRLPRYEIREAGFYPLDRLPESTTAATRRRLDEVLHGTPPADLW